jgi:hypothetical protein
VYLRITLRALSTILISAGVLLYIAAKIHFFRHYGDADYFQHHVSYWILIAAIGGTLFLLDILFPQKRTK